MEEYLAEVERVLDGTLWAGLGEQILYDAILRGRAPLGEGDEGVLDIAEVRRRVGEGVRRYARGCGMGGWKELGGEGGGGGAERSGGRGLEEELGG